MPKRKDKYRSDEELDKLFDLLNPKKLDDEPVIVEEATPSASELELEEKIPKEQETLTPEKILLKRLHNAFRGYADQVRAYPELNEDLEEGSQAFVGRVIHKGHFGKRVYILIAKSEVQYLRLKKTALSDTCVIIGRSPSFEMRKSIEDFFRVRYDSLSDFPEQSNRDKH